ncbi:MAG: hypothetical protein HQL77_16500 [Magnetococcales bacterium]|nr:hypothetical protein [Magnetococcales bacterium]
MKDWIFLIISTLAHWLRGRAALQRIWRMVTRKQLSHILIVLNFTIHVH